MNHKASIYLLILYIGFSGCHQSTNVASAKFDKSENLKVLIVDGQNNHGVFPKTTMMIKEYLEEVDIFDVSIERTKYLWLGPHHNKIKGVDSIQQLLSMYPLEDDKEYETVGDPISDPNFNPDFGAYDVVISNFGWKTADWPDETKKNFENYVENGGGFVIIHAANNAFPEWDAYNKMIGLGGWGGRNADSGPYVYYDDEGQLQYDRSEGNAGSHGAQKEFVVTSRAPDHPIMKGLPTEWLHSKDELYEKLRGPAENMTVLATAYSDHKKGTMRHEPLLMAIEYGYGRVFHTALGHMDYSVECVGFITTLLRAVEWAATGEVTQKLPDDFPTKQSVSIRKWDK